MPRNWPRDQQRKYREARRKQAALVADRLLGRKKPNPDVEDFFGGTQMRMPIQYENSTNFYNNTVRPSLIPWEVVNKVEPC